MFYCPSAVEGYKTNAWDFFGDRAVMMAGFGEINYMNPGGLKLTLMLPEKIDGGIIYWIRATVVARLIRSSSVLGEIEELRATLKEEGKKLVDDFFTKHWAPSTYPSITETLNVYVFDGTAGMSYILQGVEVTKPTVEIELERVVEL